MDAAALLPDSDRGVHRIGAGEKERAHNIGFGLEQADLLSVRHGVQFDDQISSQQFRRYIRQQKPQKVNQPRRQQNPRGLPRGVVRSETNALRLIDGSSQPTYPGGRAVKAGDHPVAVFSNSNKTIIIIKESCFVAVGQDRSECMDTSGKAAAYILGRNVVPAFANTVCNAGETFFHAVEANVVHTDAVTAVTCLLCGMRRECAGECGFLCKTDTTRKTFADAGDRQPPGVPEKGEIRTGSRITRKRASVYESGKWSAISDGEP